MGYRGDHRITRWFRDEFSCPEVEQAQQLNIDPYEIMLAAAQVPAGSEGLSCLSIGRTGTVLEQCAWFVLWDRASSQAITLHPRCP